MSALFRGAILLTAALAAGVVLIGGCSTSSSPSAGPAATTQPAATGSPSAGAAATTPASTPQATSSPAGPGPCQGSALKVALGAGSAAAGTTYYPIRFTNISATTCTLYGFPGVSFTGETYAVQVGPAASRNHSSPEHLVTLAPGAVASALISVIDAGNYSSGCGQTTASGILVYPPNLTTSVGLPFNGMTCVSPKYHVLTVNAVVAGSSGT
jgi:hypothetical protein